MANDKKTESETDIDLTASQKYWYGFLTAFPFVFVPLVAVLGILAAWIMPWLSGVEDY